MRQADRLVAVPDRPGPGQHPVKHPGQRHRPSVRRDHRGDEEGRRRGPAGRSRPRPLARPRPRPRPRPRSTTGDDGDPGPASRSTSTGAGPAAPRRTPRSAPPPTPTTGAAGSTGRTATLSLPHPSSLPVRGARAAAGTATEMSTPATSFAVEAAHGLQRPHGRAIVPAHPALRVLARRRPGGVPLTPAGSSSSPSCRPRPRPWRRRSCVGCDMAPRFSLVLIPGASGLTLMAYYGPLGEEFFDRWDGSPWPGSAPWPGRRSRSSRRATAAGTPTCWHNADLLGALPALRGADRLRDLHDLGERPFGVDTNPKWLGAKLAGLRAVHLLRR